MFDIKSLDFNCPDNLVPIKPIRPSRVLYSKNPEDFKEINISTLLEQFQEGDLLLINNSMVEKRRVIGQTARGDTYDILFALQKSDLIWEVLCKSSKIKKQTIYLPDNLTLKLIEEGRYQVALLSKPIGLDYFIKHGQMPLPFYIQKQRKNTEQPFEDDLWYQNPYGRINGSSASPTASLHFTTQDLLYLQKRGVKVGEVTLHIGLGTYLPLDEDQIHHQKIHSEWCFISKNVVRDIESIEAGKKIIALGTTTVRVIESFALGMLPEVDEGFAGPTDLMIIPGHKFQLINCMLTNFHQPKSSLLALVAAFAGGERVLKGYQWAIDRHFCFYSYGDLSVWDNS